MASRLAPNIFAEAESGPRNEWVDVRWIICICKTQIRGCGSPNSRWVMFMCGKSDEQDDGGINDYEQKQEYRDEVKDGVENRQ